jgi:hypothetical protein
VRRIRFSPIFLSLLLIPALAACDRDEDITFAQRPKDPPHSSLAANGAPDVRDPREGSLQWTVPAGWRELPAQQMRFAAFAVNDSNPPVELTVIPLGPDSAALLPNINRWEKQLGLPESPESKLPQVVKHLSMNGLQADVVDLTGAKQRMLAAIVPHGGRVWFLKLVGPVDVVTSQKTNFDAFIASLHPQDATASPPRISSQTASRLANYQTPAGWTEIPDAKPPRIKAFRANDAEVVITRFAANNAGTFEDNVTRWRGQLGLDPIADARTTPMKELTAGKDTPGILLEFHNPANNKRMLVLMASSHSDLWFIKMTGPADVVDAQRQNFEVFVKSVEFSGEEQPK